MSELHEVLAVEGDLEATAKKIIREGSDTFEHKKEHFSESTRLLKMTDESRSHEETRDHSPMVTTVQEKLDYVWGNVRRYYDAMASKERTNQDARADVTIGDAVIIKDVPATLLLGLEKRLASLRDMYLRIPTLDPGLVWDKDESAGVGVYRARDDEERFKTEKIPQHKIVCEPTKEHPAQIERWVQDVPVGKFTISRRSGMVSPAEKSEWLGRIDELIRAVKKARRRANKAEIVKMPVGRAIQEYIHG